MHKFVKVPPGTTLLELLGAKHELPAMGIRSRKCTSCLKPFTETRKIRGEVRSTPAVLCIPIICIYPLCGTCTHQLRRGGEQADAVLAAVEKFSEGEVLQ